MIGLVEVRKLMISAPGPWARERRSELPLWNGGPHAE
jgi:hypothetical protein